MRILLLTAIILSALSCKKDRTSAKPGPAFIPRCGTILITPNLDSFVYPTYYITTLVAFPEGNEVVQIHDQVTGDHDGSWYLAKYDKDSTYCTQPPK